MSRSQLKEAALRDVPYLLRGVGLNMRDSLSDLKRDIELKKMMQGFDPLDQNIPRSQRLKVLQQVYPEHDFAASLRYADMSLKRGVPKEELGRRFYETVMVPRMRAWDDAFYHARDQPSPDGQSRLGSVEALKAPAVVRAEQRKTRARRLERTVGGLEMPPGTMDYSIPSHHPALHARAMSLIADQAARADVRDPDIASKIGLQPPSDTLRNRIVRWAGKRLVDVTGEFNHDGKSILVGNPSREYMHAPGFAVPGLPLIAAHGAETLAHEVAHQTGNPLLRVPLKAMYAASRIPGLNALRFPEELRAQTNAEDILDTFRSAGVPVRPKLQDLTDEQLRHHTSALSTYADGAIRQPVSMFYSVLNNMKSGK